MSFISTFYLRAAISSGTWSMPRASVNFTRKLGEGSTYRGRDADKTPAWWGGCPPQSIHARIARVVGNLRRPESLQRLDLLGVTRAEQLSLGTKTRAAARHPRAAWKQEKIKP